MKVLVTGATGRIGRGICVALMADRHQFHDVQGIDRQPSSTAHFVGDLRDIELLKNALEGVEAVVHTAALHAPHVGIAPDKEFQSINVDATRSLAELAGEMGVQHLVFTSTTALYGHASKEEGRTAWVDEQTVPQPRTIYHRTKLAAEELLEKWSAGACIPVTVLRMSRCFPEPADLMAIYRLNRGIDARDVASAHRLALEKRLPGFRKFIVSAATPFGPEHGERLFEDAAGVIRELAPELAREFGRRGWRLPSSLDRVYDSRAAQQDLGWLPRHGFEAVLDMLDQGMSEVLPVAE
jgi:UDP-glucose 4-epimerase